MDRVDKTLSSWVFYPLGFAVSVAIAWPAFAIVHGYSEYSIARKSETTIVWNGKSRPITSAELVQYHLIGDTIAVAPLAAFATAILSLAVIPFGAVAVQDGFLYALARSAVGGAAAGFAASFLLYLFVGGWGPPYLFSFIVAGTILAATWAVFYQCKVYFNRSPNCR